MIISQVHLENCCQHRELIVRFGPGLNVIVGKNGSGKSNILKSIYAALTNDWSRNAGGKLANVTAGAAPREASVEVAFTHAGFEARVYRGFEGHEQHRLHVDGKKTANKEKLVNEAILKLLGVSAWMLDELMFVQQGKLANFLVETRGDRAENFQNLFGIGNIRNLWKVIGDDLGKTPEVVLQDVEAIEKALDELESQVSVADVAVITVTSRIPSGTDLEDEKTQNVWVRKMELMRQVEETTKDLADGLLRLEPLRLDAERLSQDTTDLEDGLAAMKPAADAAQARLTSLEREMSLRAQHARRVQDVLTLKLSKPVAPTNAAPKPGRGADELRQQETTLVSSINQRDDFLRHYRPAEGLTNCPTCGSPAEHLKEQWQRYTDEVQALKQQLLDVRHGITTAVAYDHSQNAYQTQLRVYQERESNLQKALTEAAAAIPQGPAPEPVEMRALHDAVNEYTEIAKVTTQALNDLARAEAAHNASMAERERQQQRLHRIEQERQSITVTQLDAQKARERQTLRRDVKLELAVAKTKHQTLQIQVEQMRVALQQAEAAAVQARQQNAWRGRLTEMRDYLNHDQLPTRIIDWHMARLEPAVNKYTRQFAAPFQLTPSADFSFTATKNDGTTHDIARLSNGGEQLVAALSVRMAVNDLLTSDIGFLCLDEPTYGLDQFNMRGLEALLDQLREVCANNKSQILLVTHEERLARRADHVIDLGGGVLTATGTNNN